MKLLKLSIKNAQFILILVLITVVLGIQSFNQMPRSEDPQIRLPVYIITAIYPGTSPRDIENLIIDPLEKVLNNQLLLLIRL